MKKKRRSIRYLHHFGGLSSQWPRLVMVICIQSQVSLKSMPSPCLIGDGPWWDEKKLLTKSFRLGSICWLCSSILRYFMCGIADSFHIKCFWMRIQKGSNPVKICSEFKRRRRKYQSRIHKLLVLNRFERTDVLKGHTVCLMWPIQCLTGHSSA